MSKTEKNQELKIKAVRGFFWTLFENLGGQITQFLTFIVLARLLAPETFGLISLANIFIHFVQALVDSGFSNAIIQRKDLEAEHLNTAFWANLGIGGVLTVIGIASSGLVAQFFRQPELALIISVLSINVLINSLSGTQSAVLTRELNFKGLTLRKIVSMVTGSVVGITMAGLNFGVWSLVGQTLVSSLVGCILLWRISKWRPGITVSYKHFVDLFSFGVNFVGIGLLVFFSRRIDDFLIGYFLGATALGYYTVAYKMFISLMQIIQHSTQKVSFTSFSRLQDRPDELRKVLYQCTRLISVIGIPAFIGMALVAPEFVPVFFGEQWSASIPIMQVLSFNGVLVAAMSFTGSFINSLGKPVYNLYLLSLSTVVRSLAFLIFIQQGILAIAVVLVVCNYALLPTNMWVLWRLAKIEWRKFFQQIAPSILASIVMAVFVWGFKYICTSAWELNLDLRLLLILSIIVGALSYGSVVFFMLPDIYRKISNLVGSALPSKT